MPTSQAGASRALPIPTAIAAPPKAVNNRDHVNLEHFIAINPPRKTAKQ
jgi:hypothetical protein